MTPQKAEELLKKLNAMIKAAQERRDLAVAEADNMEVRKRSLMEGVEFEVASLRSNMKTELGTEHKKLEDEIARLTSVKDGLEKRVKGLMGAAEVLTVTQADKELRSAELDAQITDRNTRLSELDEQIITATTEIKGLRDTEASIRAAIQDIEFARRQAQADIELLDKQVEESEMRIIELDANFKARKEILDAQTSEAQRKLTDTQALVVEAARKDRAIREAWADEHLKLEKRTKAVQKMEARMSDAEARIQEYDQYMSL